MNYWTLVALCALQHLAATLPFIEFHQFLQVIRCCFVFLLFLSCFAFLLSFCLVSPLLAFDCIYWIDCCLYFIEWNAHWLSWNWNEQWNCHDISIEIRLIISSVTIENDLLIHCMFAEIRLTFRLSTTHILAATWTCVCTLYIHTIYGKIVAGEHRKDCACASSIRKKWLISFDWETICS